LAIALGADARATARQAVLATGVAHAERSFAVFDSVVDEFIERSIAGHAAACDGLAEGTLSADMMALRERCTEFQRDDVLATLDVLVHADRAVVDKLDRIVDHLPKPERCGDLRYLASIGDDAAVGHPRRRAIRAELQRVRAAYHAGRYAQGEQMVTPLVTEVERSDDRALRADVLLEAARNAYARGAYDESERLRLASLVDALAVDDAELAARAALDMIYDEFSRRGRVADAGRWVAIAEGLIARTGADDLTFELTLSRSGLESVARDYSAALALYDQALTLAERQRRSPRARAAIHNNRGVALLYLGRLRRGAGRPPEGARGAAGGLRRRTPGDPVRSAERRPRPPPRRRADGRAGGLPRGRGEYRAPPRG
jgi:tetratricopeptide (TPR) repeat protein